MVKLKLDLFLNEARPEGATAVVSNSSQWSANTRNGKGSKCERVNFDLADWFATKAGIDGLSGASWAARKYKGDNPDSVKDAWKVLAGKPGECEGVLCGAGWRKGKRGVKTPVPGMYLILALDMDDKAMGMLWWHDNLLFVDEFALDLGRPWNYPIGSKTGIEYAGKGGAEQ